VLFDWDPEYVYRELIPDAQQRRWFFEHICTRDWNAEQDRGRPLAAGTALLVARHPEHELLIRAYYERWTEMLRGTLPEGIELFEQVRETGVPLYALTNWSAETWLFPLRHYPFLQGFRDIVVSGVEGVIKPDLRLYQITQQRIRVRQPEILPPAVVFVDDLEVNVDAANRFGWQGIHHVGAEQTRQRLRGLGIAI
jgi:2-haloacid dehalogenase